MKLSIIVRRVCTLPPSTYSNDEFYFCRITLLPVHVVSYKLNLGPASVTDLLEPGLGSVG